MFLLIVQHPMSAPTCAPQSTWKDDTCISKLYEKASFMPANKSCETETGNLLFVPRSETEWLAIKNMLCVVVIAHDNSTTCSLQSTDKSSIWIGLRYNSLTQKYEWSNSKELDLGADYMPSDFATILNEVYQPCSRTQKAPPQQTRYPTPPIGDTRHCVIASAGNDYNWKWEKCISTKSFYCIGDKSASMIVGNAHRCCRSLLGKRLMASHTRWHLRAAILRQWSRASLLQ